MCWVLGHFGFVDWVPTVPQSEFPYIGPSVVSVISKEAHNILTVFWRVRFKNLPMSVNELSRNGGHGQSLPRRVAFRTAFSALSSSFSTSSELRSLSKQDL